MSNGVERDVSRGAMINALGLAGRLAGPVFLILIARLYGPDTLGVYLTAVALIETALALLVAGFKDGALIFVARHADEERAHPLLYEALVNALAWSVLLALLVVLLTVTSGSTFVPKLYSSYGSSLISMLKWMCLVLPLMAVERVVMGATQGLKIMKYEAFVSGGLRPVLLIITASLFWLISPDVDGLTGAYVTTQFLVFLVVTQVCRREFHPKLLWQAVGRFRINREMISFAFPQNVNVAFDRFVTNIDVIMLGILGFSAFEIGYYGAGALIVRELRQIKLVFSSAFSPHIVRLFRERNLEQLSKTFATTSRWITTPLIPILIAVALLKGDLLQIVHPNFAGQSTIFMLHLLVIPYLQATFGLAGNVVIMTGHSKWNLFNGVTTGLSNIVLNLVLIPTFGLAGAAAASGLTAILRAALEVGEMQYLLRIPLRISQLYKPHLAGLFAAIPLVVAWRFTTIVEASIVHRVSLMLVLLLLYWGILGSMGVRIRGSDDEQTPSADRGD
ncbi:MAG TPA: oligosaccharide flippase family protein [Rhodothermales bacterium]|nr:oligosaccharide flippase family protein [Rhodothermales bacterium]